MDESRVNQNEKDSRESDATSKETLKDLEESEGISDSKQGEKLNSPDGALDEDKELDKAGPM